MQNSNFIKLTNTEIEVVKILLEVVAKNTIKLEYGELSKELEKRTGESINAHLGFITPLDHIGRLCVQLDVPSLNAIVVEKQSQKPGTGFFSLVREIRKYIGSDKEILSKARKDLLNSTDSDWQTLKEYLGINISDASITETTSSSRISEPLKISVSTEKYVTSQSLKAIVLEKSNYKCCYDNAHNTFICKSTGDNYMEGHHLIPMQHQDKFSKNIDIEENIVCLCPTCHRLLHHGLIEDKIKILKKLYDMKKEGLESQNLTLTFGELIELY